MVASALEVHKFPTDYTGNINYVVSLSWRQTESGTKKPVLVVKTNENQVLQI